MAGASPGRAQAHRAHRIRQALHAPTVIRLLPTFLFARAARLSDTNTSEQVEGGGTEEAARARNTFDVFFLSFERDVYGYLWRITGDRELASDLCQETFLRAWSQFERVSGYERPIGWLLRVATNLALNERRRGQTRVGAMISLDDERSPAQSDHAWRIAERDATHRALLALPERMRAALVLPEWGQKAPAF